MKKVVEIISDSVNPDFPKYEYVEDRSWGIWGGWYDDYYTERVLSKIPPHPVVEAAPATFIFGICVQITLVLQVLPEPVRE